MFDCFRQNSDASTNLIFINMTIQCYVCIEFTRKNRRKGMGKKGRKTNDDFVGRMNEHISSLALPIHCLCNRVNKSICTNFADVHEKCKLQYLEYGRVLLAKKDIFYENWPILPLPPPPPAHKYIVKISIQIIEKSKSR